MRLSRFLTWLLVVPTVALGGSHGALVSGPGLRVGVDKTAGLLNRLETTVDGRAHKWLHGPVRLGLVNEATHRASSLSSSYVRRESNGLSVRSSLNALPVAVTQRWQKATDGLEWTLSFTSGAPRVGHELTLEFPILSAGAKVFTPSQRGTMDLAAYPTFEHVPYGSVAWTTGETYVLPLVSVLDPKTDSAITLALPATDNIPHFQVGWSKGVLRLKLAHRGIEKGKPMTVRLLLFAHRADYRSAIKAYSDRFPAYFKPGLPRSKAEGTFYYHHIQDHPDFGEMARQSVRYLWSSFWFTHLGEYLPDASEWEPYTYSRWWNLKQTMSDAKINAFVQEMQGQGIGTYAYFNVTEYGGAGGKSGESLTADRFANALIKTAKGERIPTWEGAMAMNPGAKYSLWPVLEDQVKRHLRRLPGIEGFIIDRLDWASILDYGHDDGLTTLGSVRAENMAVPVAEAVQGVVRLSHAANKRVFVNQFYRVEPLRDVDGYCHECDYLPALGYLSPFRPASAWHQQKPYGDDLLAFEAHLKQRLHWALFPQMIAHEWPISQQGAEPRAADLLEIYRPLFDTLIGKEQVLDPHCVEVSGRNSANLFRVPSGRYVAAVTSRDRFLTRGDSGIEATALTLRVPDASKLRWAHAVSADGSPYKAILRRSGTHEVKVVIESHRTATMVVVGTGREPWVDAKAAARLKRLRAQRFPTKPALDEVRSVRPNVAGVRSVRLSLQGRQVGASGLVRVLVDGRPGGRFVGSSVMIGLGVKLPAKPPLIELKEGDEGTWFVPESTEMLAETDKGETLCVARSERGAPLRWLEPVPYSARFVSHDAGSAGSWMGRYGAIAAWLAAAPLSTQKGYRLETASPYVWAERTDDSRVPANTSGAGRRKATCWFAADSVPVRIVPPDDKPYFVTLYLLDFDRNGRALQVTASGDQSPPQKVSAVDTAKGIYLTWRAQGPFSAQIRKTKGFNAVVSAVFIDPVPPELP